MRLVLSAAFLAATLAQPAQAMTFDCDVPADRTSSVVLDFNGSPLVQGVLRPVEFRREKFNPVAGLRIENADNSTSVLLQAVELAEAPGNLTVLITVASGIEMGRRRVAVLDLAESYEFALRITPEGQMLGSFAGQTFNAPLAPVTAGKLNIFCSSGQFKFDSMVLQAG